MDFDLSADQIALRDAAGQLLERHAPRDRLRARVGDGVVVGTLPGAGIGDAGSPRSAPAGYDTELFSAMAEQGWLAVERPEDRGGLGFGMVEVAVLCEQIGRVLAPAPFLSSVLVLDALAGAEVSGDPGPVATWIEGLAAGELVGCVAWSADPHALSVSGPPDAPLLSGRPLAVLYAPSADLAVVPTAGSLYAVWLDDAKRPQPEPAMDRTREVGWLTLTDTPAVLIGGPAAVRRLGNRAATGVSAELLGGASRALEMSVAYAKDRVQFARPIGSFQAIKHKLADSLVDVEGMRSTVYYAAWCTSASDDEASLAASMAKAWCADAARRVMANALQVHGGIGFTWEHDLHLYLKRSQLDQVSYGDAGYHRDLIAGMLRERIAAGRGVL